MRFVPALAALLAAGTLSTPALAQDAGGEPLPAGTATAPDGTRAFGIEPYVAVLGGYEGFNSEPGHGIPASPRSNRLDGGLVQGIVGVNVPLGAFFVGAEGNVTKGFVGDIDWQYGAAGRFGIRSGESGMVYGKVGYQWVNFDRFGNNSPDFHAVTYGIGGEFGPKDIGLGGVTGNSGVRFRVELSTFGGLESVRPMAGAVVHF